MSTTATPQFVRGTQNQPLGAEAPVAWRSRQAYDWYSIPHTAPATWVAERFMRGAGNRFVHPTAALPPVLQAPTMPSDVAPPTGYNFYQDRGALYEQYLVYVPPEMRTFNDFQYQAARQGLARGTTVVPPFVNTPINGYPAPIPGLGPMTGPVPRTGDLLASAPLRAQYSSGTQGMATRSIGPARDDGFLEESM